MTTTGERNERAGSTREIPVDPTGSIELMCTSGHVTIRGHDEPFVRITVVDGDGIDGLLDIEATPERVRIRDAEDGTFRLGPISLRTIRSADLELDVPRRARLSVRTMSGDVDASGLAGQTRWASASGDIKLQLDGGDVTADSMSGDVVLGASAAIRLGGRTVSGDVRVRAPSLSGLNASTTSGDIVVSGALAPDGTFEVTTVSGDVSLTTDGGRFETQTVAGEVHARGSHRSEGGRGRRTILVGDGRALVRVRTMSGDIRIGRRADAVEDVSPAPTAAAAGTPREPTQPEAVPLDPSELVASAIAAPNLVRRSAAEAESSTILPAGGGGGSVDRRETARLEVLRALERGELDVDAASHRLEALEDAGPRSFRGWF